MSALVGWAIEALVGSSVLMAAVLLLRAPVRRAFGPDIAYALWALPVLRLALPPLPAGWGGVVATPVASASERMTALLDLPPELAVASADAAVPASTAPMIDLAAILPVLLILWGAGAAAFVLWHGHAHRRFCRNLLAAVTSDREIDGVRVVESAAVAGPLAFGIWQRTVALPSDLAERFEPEECDLALAHELGHHARGDLIANWIALVVLALHWFNPLAWRAFRAFRADQEIANDARVLAGMNPMRRHTYACAILKAAHGGTVSAACHLHTIDDLKGRLRMLTTTRTSRVRLLAGAGVLSLLAAAGLGLTASGTAAAAKVRTTVEDATGVRLASIDAPEAAPAPEPAPAPDPAPAPASAPSPAAAPVEHLVPVVVIPVPATPRTRVHIVRDDVAGPGLPPPPATQPPATQPPTTPPMTPPGVAVSPEAPAAPRVMYAPSAVTVTVDENGKRVLRYGRTVRVGPDGTVLAMGRPVAIPPVPRIVSRRCGPGAPDTRIVSTDRNGTVRSVVLCTDRIAAAAARGAAMAANGRAMERSAYASALDGLRTSRARVTTSLDMSAAERKAALAGIDTALRELEDDLAHAR